MILFVASGWLHDEMHEVVRKINRRMEAVTGLSAQTAEDLQVIQCFYKVLLLHVQGLSLQSHVRRGFRNQNKQKYLDR